jgi:hypothetical protein
MKLKLFISTLIAGALLGAAPVWAHGGHHGRHWEKHSHHHKFQRHHHRRHVYRDRVVVREYVERVPVYRDYYPAPAPAPGISIVTPDIFIPWPR